MLRIFDRYLVREILAPFCLALVVLTFILLMPPILENAQQLIAKGVDAPTIARILLTLMPQALSVTIPMALLYGILMGLGRLSSDREFVALQACGVSIFRAMRPIAALAVLAFAADQYVLLVALPNANQTFREITFNVVASKAESDVKARAFYQGFPNRVVYVRDVLPDRGWQDVFLADTSRTDQTSVYFASGGHLLIDREQRTAHLQLDNGTRHTTYAARPEEYDVDSFDRLVLNLDADNVFKRTTLLKGDNEMTVAELRADVEARKKQHQPYSSQLFTIQQKFSIPVSCLVLAAIGLALGASSRKDGALASFALGSGVIFVYYVLLYTARAAANGGRLSPTIAPWVVNVVLGLAGAALVFWRAGSSGEGVRIALPRLRSTTPAASDQSQTSQPRRPDRVIVVVRVPQLGLPRPNLLDLYIIRRYLSVFLLAFFSLIGIFYIATFIDLADKLFRGSTTTGMLLRYFYFQTPQYVYFIVPLAALLSTLVTVGVLTKNSELIVMRACGISLYRSALPLLLFGIFLSATLFQLQERVLAESNREAQRLNAIIRGWPTQTYSALLSHRWIVSQSGDLYYYEFFDPRSNQFSRFSMYHPEASRWRLNALTFAGNVAYVKTDSGYKWQARQGWQRNFSTPQRRASSAPAVAYRAFDQLSLPLEAPGYFKSDEPDAERMSYGELSDYVTQLQKSGYYSVPYQVQLQKKVAFPFVALIMTLLAIPFAVTTGRSGALYGIGIGIALAIVYWTGQSMFGAMGGAGLLSPVLAAWAPNIIFTAGAVYMILTVKT
ncbi:MAG TPA: LptF/LptG family permease [Vicinamibacterales bacterium]|jgi:LPS export ABC transporter permease LptG/LPS export ABC transporter permease LptF